MSQVSSVEKKKRKKAVQEDEGVITGPGCSVMPSCVDARRALGPLQDQPTQN